VHDSICAAAFRIIIHLVPCGLLQMTLEWTLGRLQCERELDKTLVSDFSKYRSTTHGASTCGLLRQDRPLESYESEELSLQWHSEKAAITHSSVNQRSRPSTITCTVGQTHELEDWREFSSSKNESTEDGTGPSGNLQGYGPLERSLESPTPAL
jgi:hypothetical protein